MEGTGVELRGWGSASKRPLSWVASYGAVRYHQGSGLEHCRKVDTSNSLKHSRSPKHRTHRREQDTVIMHQCEYRIKRDSGPLGHTTGPLGQGTGLLGQGTSQHDVRNRHSNGLMEDGQDVQMSGQYPPPPIGYMRTSTNYTDQGYYPVDCRDQGFLDYSQIELNSNVCAASYPDNHAGEDDPIPHQQQSRPITYNTNSASVARARNNNTSNMGANHYTANTGAINGYVCDDGRSWYAGTPTSYSPSSNRTHISPSNRLSPNNNSGVTLVHNINQLDWSPEKVSSSGSSFDSGYNSSLNNANSGLHQDPVASSLGVTDVYYQPCRSSNPAAGAPYQLSQRADCYQSGLKRTLDKCEDHCVQEVHPSQVWADLQSDWESIIKVKYIGSFSVIGEEQNARAEYVRKQLMEMRNVTKTKPVLLVISLSGVKVCSSTGESVYMAHALKRISYATCDPDCCQFSFLAREPKGHTNIQYCHAFVTKSSQEAEELNAIIGNAFKMAFTHQRENQKVTKPAAPNPSQPADTPASPPIMQRQPTFHEMIEHQIEFQREQNEVIQRRQQEELNKRLSEISTPKVDERMKELTERRKRDKVEQDKEQEVHRLTRLQGKDRTSWAKHVAGRTKHKSPLRNQGNGAMGDPHSKHSSSPQHGSRPNSGAISPPVVNGSPQFNPLSTSVSPNMKPLPFSSLTALRDAFNAGELRSYGSPVMTLKETIDKIQWTEQADDADDQKELRNSGHDTVDAVPSSSWQAPSSPEVNSALQTQLSQTSTDFSQRPLPATPPEILRKSRPKAHKSSTQRSSPPNPEESASASPRPQSNGHMPHSSLRGRPVSGRFQNDSPMHSRSIEVEEGGENYQGPPTPLRYDSLRKIDRSEAPIEEDLKNAPWYQAGIPREIALEMLTQEDIGSFVVRDSTTHPGCYALSVKVPKFDNPMGISHYLIMRTSHGGVKLKGLDKEWTSLTALVTHHSVMRELLPCPLRLPRAANNPAFSDDDKGAEPEEDEDYQRLADCSHMMHDLKL